MADVEPVVRIEVGEERRISLPGRGAGGFTWTISQTGAPDVVAVRREAGKPPALPPAGGPPPPSFSLDEVLVVTALKAGSAGLDLRLGRPAASGEAPIDRRFIRIEVTPQRAQP